jgi:O-antigen/teichoic acid export membrane protein
MVTRSQRFVRTLVSGYGSIVANLIFTMASIPLALDYLSKEQFGLWALALQVNGYLSLLELGMGSATLRFVADHKDDVDGGEYGSLLLTGGWVFAIQGLIVGLAGVGISAWAPSLFAIPSELSGDFTRVLATLASITGISIMSRMFGVPLWAFQRLDVVNGLDSAGLLLRLLLMWLGFHLGLGIDSLAWAQLLPTLITLVASWRLCLRNGYYPRRGCWGRPRWDIFIALFSFARDTLLLSLGSQMVNASQITIISRFLGLDAAASFSIATKLYAMVQQVFHKVVESATPGLVEMHVRGENEQFIQRYREIISITLGMSTVGSVFIVVGNSAFVSIWTNHSVLWLLGNDVTLGILVVLTGLSRCFVGVFGIVKNLHAVRLLYFLEGVVYIPSAILAAMWYGLPGVLIASAVSHLAVTSFYSARAASGVLGSWLPLLSTVAISGLLIGFATLVAWIGTILEAPPLLRLSLVAPLGLCSIVAMWFFAIPINIRIRVKNAITSRLGITCRI